MDNDGRGREKGPMEMMEGEGEAERGISRSERVKHVRRRNGQEDQVRRQREGISRADLPSCGEMADHHRRVIREPNTPVVTSVIKLLGILCIPLVAVLKNY